MIYTIQTCSGKRRHLLFRRSAARHIIRMLDKHEDFIVIHKQRVVFEGNSDIPYLTKYDEEETQRLTAIMHNMLARRRVRAGLAP